jgi:hypothetical protein
MSSALQNFLNQFPENEQDKRDEYKFRFGKFKGLTYKTVYENKENLKYIRWVIESKENQYFKSFRAYCLDRIQKEYTESMDVDGPEKENMGVE